MYILSSKELNTKFTPFFGIKDVHGYILLFVYVFYSNDSTTSVFKQIKLICLISIRMLLSIEIIINYVKNSL